MTQQEGLITIFFCKKIHHYLLEYKAKIVTYHRALTYLVNKSNPSGWLLRWMLLMDEFDLDIVHCWEDDMAMLMALQRHMKEWVMFEKMTTFQM